MTTVKKFCVQLTKHNYSNPYVKCIIAKKIMLLILVYINHRKDSVMFNLSYM